MEARIVCVAWLASAALMLQAQTGKEWDKPLNCNTSYPFSYNETTYSVMADRPGWFTYNSNMPNPVGTYRRTFTIPAEWEGRDVYVRFNSVGHGYYLWTVRHGAQR